VKAGITPLAGKLVVVPGNPLTTDAHGNVIRLLPVRGGVGGVCTEIFRKINL
jgi:hypothetical protein